MLYLPATHRLQWLVFALSFLVLVLHALRMPVQYDEAAMILSVHDQGAMSSFTHYENGTNNHVLVRYLIGLLLGLGATDIFLLRVPSLLAGIAIMLAASRLGKRLPIEMHAILPLLVVSMPLFFDYLVMVRGYAMGLAFLLWGILVFPKSWTLSGVLFALSTLCVPTYSLDVLIAGGMLLLSGERWRNAILAVGLGGVISLLGYSLVLPDVITVLRSLSDESPILATRAFLISLSGYGLTAGAAILLTGVAISLWSYRDKKVLASPLLLSLPFVPLGYARTHLFTALLLILALVPSVSQRRWTTYFLLLYCAGSLALLPWDRIATEPNMWPVTGFSVARELSPCLSIQRKGIFSVPHDFYRKLQNGPPFKPDCPNFLMVREDSLNIPHSMQLYKDVLAPYNVEMYRTADLQALLQLRMGTMPTMNNQHR